MTKPFAAEEIALQVRLVLDSRKQQKRVLIVDNDESLRRMLAALLESAGYEITQASNGREALNHAGTLEMDTILTEIVIPEVEGLHLIQKLLQLKPSIPDRRKDGKLGWLVPGNKESAGVQKGRNTTHGNPYCV